jgi:hypothetical protein
LNAADAEHAEHAEKNQPSAPSAKSAASWSILLLALIFFALHLPYLPRSLEDLDSINFALGVRQFDVARHQPHPPGYPVYIAAAKTIHALVPEEARALALLGVVTGALGVLAIAALFRRLDGVAVADRWTIAGTAVAVTSPLYWFTAVRPLSDMTGLAAAIGVQALTLAARTPRAFLAAGFAAGAAAGIRSQVVWLTVPLLLVRVLAAGSWEQGSDLPARHSHATRAASLQLPAACALMFLAGVLLWFLPLVAITGGPVAYWRALFTQGAEDFGNISMLWTTHNARAITDAAYYRFVAPWGAWTPAAIVLTLALCGAVVMFARARSSLALLAAAFAPYLAFDLLFQETFTGRYALPLVVPIAYLATAALRRVRWNVGIAAATALAMFDAHISGISIAAFAREKAPAFRLLDDMTSAARAASEPAVLAMDRRNTFDFRRPIIWTDGAMPAIARQLAAPPQHEWLEAVHYWNAGGRAPVWFIVDPKRAAIDLLQHGEPSRYRWNLPYPDLVSGARPNEMDWYAVDRPDWYVGDGWALTPEAAGVADADRRGLSSGAVSAWISAGAAGTADRPGALMIGGRNFESSLEPQLSIELDGHSVLAQRLARGPFLRLLRRLPVAAERDGYLRLVVRTDPPAHVALEQFDVASARPLFGFGEGWHEQELNPRTGVRWRWLSERGVIHVMPVGPVAGKSAQPIPLGLHVRGESPKKYFSRPSTLTIRVGNRVLSSRQLDADFSLDVAVPVDLQGDEPIVFETDQTYIPAERSRRTGDRRHLGLRIFNVAVFARGTIASSPPAR